MKDFDLQTYPMEDHRPQGGNPGGKKYDFRFQNREVNLPCYFSKAFLFQDHLPQGGNPGGKKYDFRFQNVEVNTSCFFSKAFPYRITYRREVIRGEVSSKK